MVCCWLRATESLHSSPITEAEKMNNIIRTDVALQRRCGFRKIVRSKLESLFRTVWLNEKAITLNAESEVAVNGLRLPRPSLP